MVARIAGIVVAKEPVMTTKSKIFHPFARKLRGPRPKNRTSRSTAYIIVRTRKILSERIELKLKNGGMLSSPICKSLKIVLLKSSNLM